MARYGIIENNKVKNIIIADADFADSYEHDLNIIHTDSITIA